MVNKSDRSLSFWLTQFSEDTYQTVYFTDKYSIINHDKQALSEKNIRSYEKLSNVIKFKTRGWS